MSRRRDFNQFLIGIAIMVAVIAVVVYFTRHADWTLSAFLISLVIFADAQRDIWIEEGVLARRAAAMMPQQQRRPGDREI